MSDAQESGAATNEAADTQNTDAAAQANASAQGNADSGNAEGANEKPQGEGEQQGGDKPAEPQVPGAYDFKMPEGFTLDEARAVEFSEVAKGLKLNQEQAQQLVDLHIKSQTAQVEAHAAQVQAWGGAVASDPELGKPENQAVAKKVIEQFGTPELKQYLQSTGLGNHPELVGMVYRIGKAISEDTFQAGRSGAAGRPQAPEDILYGKS